MNSIEQELLQSAKSNDISTLEMHKSLINELPPPFIRKLLNIALKHGHVDYIDKFFEQHKNIEKQMFSNVEYISKISKEEGYRYLYNYFMRLNINNYYSKIHKKSI